MIQKLYIHNFKCLENFTLHLEDNTSWLLIGKNGSGKSTVSQALEVLQSIGRGTNRVGKLVKFSDLGRDDGSPVRIELTARMGGSTYEYRLGLELPEKFRELRILAESLTVDGRHIFSREHAQVTLVSSNRESRFLVDWHLVALPVIQELSERDPLATFKTWLSRMLILAPIPSLISGDSESDSLMVDRRVTQLGSWFTGLLAQWPAAYTDVDRFIRDVMPDFHDIKNPAVGRDSRSLTVQFKAGQSSLSLPFEQLSDGEKCFFICAMVIAAKKHYGPLVCFWDEPDNFLSLSEIGQFVMELRRAFQEENQIVISSHNDEAIRQFSDENTLILHRRSHLEPTQVTKLSRATITGDLVNAMIRDDLDL